MNRSLQFERVLVTGGAVLVYTERAFSRRLRHFIGDSVGEVDRATPALVSRTGPSFVQRANRAFARSQIHQALRRELIRAGSPLHPGQFIYLRALSTVAGGLLPIVTRYMDHSGDTVRDVGMEYDDRPS